jgi:rfaE bifunctional protein nucleotidyltransferase chain/domain
MSDPKTPELTPGEEEKNPDAVITNLAELVEKRAAWKETGERVVFANGCFDGLHGGHVSYLEDAAQQGDRLIIGVNDDASVRGLKGENRPLMPLADRIEMLANLMWADAVVAFSEPTCAELLRTLRPDIHAKGTDYSVETVPEKDVAEELGIEIYIAGPPKENATRKIIARMQENPDDEK